MSIDQLIALCIARIASLISQRTAAERLGDVEQVTKLEEALATTQATLSALQSL